MASRVARCSFQRRRPWSRGADGRRRSRRAGCARRWGSAVNAGSMEPWGLVRAGQWPGRATRQPRASPRRPRCWAADATAVGSDADTHRQQRKQSTIIDQGANCRSSHTATCQCGEVGMGDCADGSGAASVRLLCALEQLGGPANTLGHRCCRFQYASKLWLSKARGRAAAGDRIGHPCDRVGAVSTASLLVRAPVLRNCSHCILVTQALCSVPR